jgi:hypothetical protein
MKGHMNQHVNTVAPTMYAEATGQVRSHLEAMFQEACAELERQKEAIFADMYKDYMNVLAGTQMPHDLMPKAERMMREDVVQEVRKTADLFQRLLLGENVDEVKGNADEEMREVDDAEIKIYAHEETTDDVQEAANADGNSQDIETAATTNHKPSKHATTTLEDADAEDDAPMPDIDNDDSEDDDYRDDEEEEIASRSSGHASEDEE